MKKILALDPGETTGYAVVRADGTLLECGEFSTSLRVDNLLRVVDVCVCEAFNLRADKAKSLIGSSFKTVEVIGAIKILAAQHAVDIVEQQPSQKRFYSNARLKRLGVYVVGKRHANDALRHALYYVTFTLKTYAPPS